MRSYGAPPPVFFLSLVTFVMFGAVHPQRAVAGPNPPPPPPHPAQVVLTRTSISPVAADLGAPDDKGNTSGCQINFHAEVYDQNGQPLIGGTAAFSASPGGVSITPMDTSPPQVDAMVASSVGGTFNVTCTVTATVGATNYTVNSSPVSCEFSAGHFQAVATTRHGSGGASGSYYFDNGYTAVTVEAKLNGVELIDTSTLQFDDSTSIDITGDAEAVNISGLGGGSAQVNGSGQDLVKYAVSWVPSSGATNPAPPGFSYYPRSHGQASVGARTLSGSGSGGADARAYILGGSGEALVDVTAPGDPPTALHSASVDVWISGGKRSVGAGTTEIPLPMNVTMSAQGTAATGVSDTSQGSSAATHTEGGCYQSHVHYDNHAPLYPA